jgi:hypothetical protein
VFDNQFTSRAFDVVTAVLMIQVFWHDKGVYTGKKITDVFMDESIPIQVIVKF